MSAQTHDCRDTFAATLLDLATADESVVAIVNDSVGSSKLGTFGTTFPSRLINVGIAEQNQVGIAAGLANGGKVPFVSCAGSFLSARAMEQVKADVAYSRHHVVLCAQSPGVAYGPLGATHHSIEDVAWMRILPNLTVIVPADPVETEQALRWAHQHDGPVYIRISRMAVPDVHPADYAFTPGRSWTLREGTDVTLMANGTVLWRALEAATTLEAEGISTRVVSMASVKPLDEAAVIAAARETRGIVTVEEGFAAGGLGGAVAEVVTRTVPTRVRALGFSDAFVPTGSTGWLIDEAGMTADGIAHAARDLVG